MNRILIVSNDDVSLKFFLNVFRDKYEIFTTTLGTLYIDDVKNGYFDAIILGLEVDDKNAFEFLEALKIKDKELETPIIVGSARGDDEMQKKAFKLGASDYLLKPYDMENVRLRIENLVSRYHVIRGLKNTETAINDYSNYLKTSLSKDNTFNFFLKELGESVHARRTYYTEFDEGMIKTLYEWTSDEKYSLKGNINTIKGDIIDNSMERYKKDQVVAVINTSILEKENPKAYEYCCEYGIKTFASAPIIVNSRLIGFIGCDNPEESMISRVKEFMTFIAHGISNCLEKMEYQNKLEYDGLTGLYKYEKYLDIVSKILPRSKAKHPLFVKVDFSRFQGINSYFGLKEGDKLLKLLPYCFKKYFNNYLCASRLNSDDFSFVCDEDLAFINESINKTKAYLIRNSRLSNLDIRFGIYVITDVNESVSEMLRKAMLAHERCKQSPNNNYVVYKDEFSLQAKRQQELFDNFSKAIENKEFKVFIQPKYNIFTNTYSGGEALVRWIRDDGTILSPGEFIPFFENNGLINQLDFYMINSLCILIRKWLDEGKTVKPISVNLSRIDFYNPNLTKDVLKLIDKSNVPHNLIEIEITESAYALNQDNVENFCLNMKEEGILTIMDDFGSGYSSLNTLKDLDLSVIKMDQKFVSKTKHGSKQRIIISSVIEMIHKLNLKLVIEGVEDKEASDYFKELGVELIQGFYYGKPMPHDEFIKLLNE